MVIGVPNKDNNGREVDLFTLQGKTWTADKKLAASDGESNEYFSWSVAIIRDTLLVGYYVKYYYWGRAPMCAVFSGDRSWDEGTKIIPINGITSGYSFGHAVGLSVERNIIGSDGCYEKGYGGGAAYVFHRVNGVWQEESELVPSDGESYDKFGKYVALSGDKYIIKSPYDDGMGSSSESIYVFVRQKNGTWEEVQKITPYMVRRMMCLDEVRSYP